MNKIDDQYKKFKKYSEQARESSVHICTDQKSDDVIALHITRPNTLALDISRATKSNYTTLSIPRKVPGANKRTEQQNSAVASQESKELESQLVKPEKLSVGIPTNDPELDLWIKSSR